MDASGSLGAVVALVAAVVWGSGDYAGGRATRGYNPYQVLGLVSVTGLVLMILAALVRGESWPDGASILWSAVAGAAGGFGIAALYYGLAKAEAAVVSPTSAVVGAMLPVLVGALTAGLPGPLKIGGMFAGLLGIWIVTRGSAPAPGSDRQGLSLGVIAGIGFAGFFICMAQVPRGAVFGPLMVSKAVATALALVVLALRRLSMPSPRANPVAVAAGLLDAGGNVFYLIASHLTRLDFAAVIASMSPAVTVVLSRTRGRQPVSRLQWFGVLLCMVGVALIAA
jgi:drug/metabolite transporter (DMT)-like permease